MDDPEVLALIPAIQEQLAAPETQFVSQALSDLRENHQIEEDEACYMLAFCLADELESMAAEHRNFDLARYKLLISLLPKLPE